MATRAVQRRATRAALADAALDLFEQHGYDQVTMDDIARAAGVSRPTAFRHFGSKADVVLAVQDEWLRIVEEGIAQALPGETPWFTLRRVSHAIAAHIETDRERVLRSLLVIAGHPALWARAAVQSVQWQGLVAAHIRPAVAGDLAAAMTGGAVMGMIQAVVVAWAADSGNTDMHALLDEGFDLLAGGLGG